MDEKKPKKEGRPPDPEKDDVLIFIQLHSGDKIIGRIEDSDSTTLYIRSIHRPNDIQSIHKVFIKRRFIIIQGGKA